MVKPRTQLASDATVRALGIGSVASVAVILALSALRRVWGADYWWQWATGRHVVEHGFPTVDVFSYTASGQPWVELRWLYCVVLYGVTTGLGVGAAVLIKTLVLLASFALVTAAVLRRNGLVAAGLVTGVATLAFSQRFFLRPELATYLFFALFVWVIARYRAGGTRWLYILPIIQVIWVNSHTLFILGPLLVGLLATVTLAGHWLSIGRGGEPDAGSRRRVVETGVVLLLTSAACLLNPYGWDGIAFPFQLFSQIRGTAFKETISEFRSPFSFAVGYTAVVYYKVLIALCVGSLLLNVRRLDPFYSILAGSQLYLSLLAIRNLPLFCLAAIPFVIDNLQRSRLWEAPAVRRRLPALRAGLAIGIMLFGAWLVRDLATNRFHVRQGDTNRIGIGMAEHRYPVEATEFLDRHASGARLFNTMREGSYLLAHGHRVFIDPRLEVYGESRYEAYVAAIADPTRWSSTMRQHDVEVVLVDVASKVVNHALASDRWRLVHFDEVAAVFFREDVAVGVASVATRPQDAVTRIRKRLGEVPADSRPGPFGFVESDAAYRRVADLLLVLRRPDLAMGFLQDAERLALDPVPAMRRQAVALEMLGDTDASVAVCESILARDPKDAPTLFRLATHRANTGKTADARGLVERYLALRQDNATVWALHGKLCATTRDYQTAADSLARAAQLDPADPGIRRNLAIVLFNLGRAADAREQLRRGLELAPNDPKLLELQQRVQ